MRERTQTTNAEDDRDRAGEDLRREARTEPDRREARRPKKIRGVVKLAKVILVGGSFAVAAVGAVAIHANKPTFRRLATTISNRVMGDLFEGKIVISDLRSLSVGRESSLNTGRVEILDPQGHRVILAEDVSASIDLARLLGAMVEGAPVFVDLSTVRIRGAEVVLDVDPATHHPTIAKTFTPRKTAATAAPTPTQPTAVATAPRDPTVRIPNIRIDHAWVHGDIVPPKLDAEGIDLDASVNVEHAMTRVELRHGKTMLRSPRAPSQLSDITGDAKAILEVALRDDIPIKGNAELDGSCGEVRVQARAGMVGDDITASVDIPRTEPSKLSSAFEGLPITAPTEIHAHAKGKLPTVMMDLTAMVGEGRLVATGEIDLREGRAFKLDVDASKVDASVLGAGTASNLSAKGHAEGVLGDHPLGTFKVSLDEGVLAEAKVPKATIDGRFEGSLVTMTVRAAEPGVDLSGKIDLDVKTKLATFDVQGRSSSLKAIARIPKTPIDGAATARARGQVDLGAQTITATASAAGDGIAASGFGANHVSADAKITGPLRAPVIDLTFTGDDLKLQATDKAKTPLVYPRAKGSARIALGDSPRILNASIDIDSSGKDGAVALSARNIRVDGDVVEARGLRIEGLGNPVEIDARVSRGAWSLRAKSEGIDLRRAAAVTGIKELSLLPEGTRAELDVDLDQSSARANGHFDVVVRSANGAFGSGAVTAEVHGKIERGKVTGSARLAAEEFGQLELARADIDLPNGRLDARTIKRATGTAELRGTVDLSQGAALLLGEHVERVGGIATFEARVERGDPTTLPAIRGTVKTDGLEVALISGTPPDSETTLIQGVDVQANIAWDGRTEDAEASLVSWDRHGLLGSANAKSRIPVLKWISRPSTIDASAVADLPVDVTVDVPSRELAELPTFMRGLDLKGALDGKLRIEGTVAHPQLTATAHATGLAEERDASERRGGQRSRSFQPLDGSLEARWDGERATVTLAVDERQRQRSTRTRRPGASTRQARAPRTPGHLRGMLLMTDVNMSNVLSGTPLTRMPWRASAEVELENLTLAALPFISSNGVSGVLTGRARVKDINQDPSFEATAHVDNLGVSGTTVSAVDVTVGGRNRSLFASVALDATDPESRATVQVASQSVRIDRLRAGWDATSPTRVDYAIVNKRLAIIAPLIKRWVPEIDGRVDGAGNITFDAESQTFEGGLAIQQGRVYLNQLGEEVTNLTATARFERSGTWRIDDATGNLGAGEFRASATGRMRGLDFVDAEATVVVAKDAIPLSSEGATFAEAIGEVKLVAKMANDRSALLMTVSVPRAEIKLPDQDTQKLEPLAADPTVKVGIRMPNGDVDTSVIRKGRGGTGAAQAPKTTILTKIDVELGDNVQLEGRGLDINITGKTLVELAQELSVSGRIDLQKGTIVVHGRRFTVDTGTVTFPDNAEPSNPTIVATAYWDAPDRTRVWVEFMGPLRTGKLTLRSEPPYSKNEILSVLLFGRPDPNLAAPTQSGSSQSSQGSAATAVGSGFIATDLTRALSEIDENLDVETDTLAGNRTRAKIGRTFFDRRLKIQLGVAPGSTYREPDTAYVFVNWQFIPKWSIVATQGNRGTSILDVLFQHRY